MKDGYFLYLFVKDARDRLFYLVSVTPRKNVFKIPSPVARSNLAQEIRERTTTKTLLKLSVVTTYALMFFLLIQLIIFC